VYDIKLGRPSRFNEVVADAICERITKGESVAQICDDKSMPSLRTVWRWKRENPSFRHDYEQAKEACVEYYALQIMEIADDRSLLVHDRRIMIDARKWASGRMKPKENALPSPPNISHEAIQNRKQELMEVIQRQIREDLIAGESY
jgi:hypothetical protein